jgi:hypothetical protein
MIVNQVQCKVFGLSNRGARLEKVDHSQAVLFKDLLGDNVNVLCLFIAAH